MNRYVQNSSASKLIPSSVSACVVVYMHTIGYIYGLIWKLKYLKIGMLKFQNSSLFLSFFKRFYLFIFRERGREGERERNINVWYWSITIRFLWVFDELTIINSCKVPSFFKLSYNWHTLYEFQVYNIMIWYFYIL